MQIGSQSLPLALTKLETFLGNLKWHKVPTGHSNSPSPQGKETPLTCSNPCLYIKVRKENTINNGVLALSQASQNSLVQHQVVPFSLWVWPWTNHSTTSGPSRTLASQKEKKKFLLQAHHCKSSVPKHWNVSLLCTQYVLTGLISQHQLEKSRRSV